MRKVVSAILMLSSLYLPAREVIIPEGRTKISISEFRGDTTLTTVKLPSSLKSIGDYAFEGCINLKNVEFSKDSKSMEIGDYAFYECASLDSVSLPSGATLSTGVFQDCSELKYLKLPAVQREIPAFLCRGCKSLERITLPGGLVKIHRLAFAYCSSLNQINFPSTLRHIGMDAFAFCTSLKSVSLPSGVTSLESYSFAECTGLEKVSVGGSIKEFGELVFSGCRSLRQLKVNRAVPPVFECESFVFEPDEEEMYRQCELIVPSGSAGLYRKSRGWSLFKNILSGQP